MTAGTVIHLFPPNHLASARSHHRVFKLLHALQMWLLGGQRVCSGPDGTGVSGTQAGSHAKGLRIEVPGCSFSS